VKPRRMLARAGLGGAAGLIAAVALFPFCWAALSSLEPASALFRVHYWPSAPSLAAYRAVFAQQAFGHNILNSTLVAGATVVLALGAALPAAYALGRVRFRGRMALLFTILAVTMFPQVAVLSGLFELIRALGLYNRWPGLALSYTLFTLPFTVWVLTTFTAQLPRELEEAALVDGATVLDVIVRVFVPLLAPALVTSGLLAFIAAWNEFLFALTFTLSDAARTVPVAIALISGASAHELPWAQVMAALVTVTLPLVALVLAFQRRIVAGLTAGAVKG